MRNDKNPDLPPDGGGAGRGHDDGDKPDKPFDAVTRLYIRTHPADDGSEPFTASPNFWESPDVLIVQPGGAVGGVAVPLELNHVRVVVTNGGGIPAVDAYVDAFVANPSTGFTPVTAEAIPGDWVTVQAYSTAVVDLPWTPRATDSGHRCIIARVSLVVPFDSYTDPTVFDVVGDRHVAQRNISVLEVPAGKSMSFRFELASWSEDHARANVRAFERTREVELGALVKAAGCVGGLPATEPLAGLAVRTLSAREVQGRPSLSAPTRIALGIAERPERSLGAPELAARLDKEGAPRVGVVTFAVADGEEPGRLHVVDVVETDAASDRVVGGLTFIIRAT